MLKYRKQMISLVKFKKFSDIEKIQNFFNHPYKKKSNPTKNSSGEVIEVLLAYELIELTLSNYFAVILRNLPHNCSQEEVKSFCDGRVTGVLYALHPQKIKNSVCSVVVFRDLDDAENLCISLKKDQSKNKKIKVHVHPRSCKIRKHPDKSHFSKMLVRKEKIKFSRLMTSSSEMIAKSTSFVKVQC